MPKNSALWTRRNGRLTLAADNDDRLPAAVADTAQRVGEARKIWALLTGLGAVTLRLGGGEQEVSI